MKWNLNGAALHGKASGGVLRHHDHLQHQMGPDVDWTPKRSRAVRSFCAPTPCKEKRVEFGASWTNTFGQMSFRLSVTEGLAERRHVGGKHTTRRSLNPSNQQHGCLTVTSESSLTSVHF